MHISCRHYLKCICALIGFPSHTHCLTTVTNRYTRAYVRFGDQITRIFYSPHACTSYHSGRPTGKQLASQQCLPELKVTLHTNRITYEPRPETSCLPRVFSSSLPSPTMRACLQVQPVIIHAHASHGQHALHSRIIHLIPSNLAPT